MEKNIVINHFKINFQEQGEGEVILLLHGWGCDSNIFKNIQQHLSQKFKTFSLDLLGFGKSDKPDVALEIYDYVKIVEKFCIAFNIENPILIGHSFGGRISIVFASRNKTKKVVLVDSAGIKPKRKLNYYLKVYFFKFIKQIFSFPFLKSQKEKVTQYFRKKFGSSDYQNLDGVMRETFVKIVNEDLQKFLSQIKASTLLIWGEHDTATPVSDAKIMEKNIPDAGLVVLKNCGHYSFLEKTYEFLLILDNFLQ